MWRSREKLLSLAGLNTANQSKEELQSLFSKVMDAGMHGLCFSPYLEGQEPGTILSESQIRKRIEIGLIKLLETYGITLKSSLQV